MHDLIFQNLGSMAAIKHATLTGKQWLVDNVHWETWQEQAGRIYLDVRFAIDIMEGAQLDGLTIGVQQ